MIYINDISKCLSNCKIVLLADDALLYISQLNLIGAVNYVQSDLNRNNGGCNNIRQEIKEHEIEKVDKIKYLGIIIDTKLK